MLQISGNDLHLEHLTELAHGAAVTLDPEARSRVELSRAEVRRALESGAPIYGVNTGFGYYAKTAIDREELRILQVNLLKSHACGHGKPLSQEETRVAMCLRLNVLMKGLTGVRWELCEQLMQLIQHEIYPVIPECGSVGASGDLAPLAHLALPLIGCGDVLFRGQKLAARDALKAVGMQPLELEPKEGLGLINGTQIMLAVGGLALATGHALMEAAELCAALSYEALGARISPLHPQLHAARGQLGQQQSAACIRAALEGSSLCDPERASERVTRVQDPYSLRCAPQVHGATRDIMAYATGVVERELNAATDNPLVLGDEIVSGGNFHGQPIALAFDAAALGLAELGSISERRLELLLNPQFSHQNAFLSAKEGTQSGYMAAQYLSASLVNENKILAHPASADSIPGNVGVEDHVSMGMTSARHLRQLVGNLKTILAVELIAAAQALDLQGLPQLGERTGALYAAVRQRVPRLDDDRVIAEDVAAIVDDFEAVVSSLQQDVSHTH